MTQPIEWSVSPERIAYPEAVATMEARAEAIAEGRAREWLWLIEHPPLYTAGTSAKAADLLSTSRLPVYRAGRGGQFTYHGPGQRVVYVMLNLSDRGRDVRRFVTDLEQVVIETLAAFGIAAERRAGRVGVWVLRPDGREEKVAAIGIRLRRWVSFHGLSLNVAPDLTDYEGIVPCGLPEYGVTSLHALGVPASMAEVDRGLRRAFEAHFGPTVDSPPPDLKESASG